MARTNSTNFDYALLHGKRVLAITGCRIQSGRSRTTAEKVAIRFERETLLITVNEDTDEVVLQEGQDNPPLTRSSRRWKSIGPLKKYVGRNLGWGWVARNYNGYADLFILSFDGIEPQIVFCAVASGLWIYKLKRV